MQLEVQTGSPITLTDLDAAPFVEVGVGRQVAIVGLDAAPVLSVGAEQPIALIVAPAPILTIEVGQVLTLDIGAEQGLPGPPGAGGGEPAQRADYTGARYWYLGYSDHIVRVDQGVSPPTTGRADSTDWAGRVGLEYA